jgi:predicted dithiol-disulfide oxidoreductase (DUF899 family)
MSTYTFDEGPRNPSQDQPVAQTTLHHLVEEKSLVAHHLIFAEYEEEACQSCSMWNNGFNGIADNFDQHVNIVIIAKAPLIKLRSWGRLRGWHKIRLLSSFGSTFSADMNLERSDWMPNLNQALGISVFRKDGDAVRHVYSSTPESTSHEVRAIDLLSPIWNVLDIVSKGRGEWNPSNSYIKELKSRKIKNGRNQMRKSRKVQRVGVPNSQLSCGHGPLWILETAVVIRRHSESAKLYI